MPLVGRISAVATVSGLDPKALDAKVKALLAAKASEPSANQTGALARIREDATYAVKFLNERFRLDLQVPSVQLLNSSDLNAYWSQTERTYYAPAQVQHMSDITYHEMAYLVPEAAMLHYQGQSGALVQSYGDIIASFIRVLPTSGISSRCRSRPASASITWMPFARCWEARAVDVLILDLAGVGGVTPWRKIAAVAQAHRVVVSGHAVPEIQVHLLASIPNGHLMEYVPRSAGILTSMPRIEGGKLVAPHGPGLGLEFDDVAVRRHQVA